MIKYDQNMMRVKEREESIMVKRIQEGLDMLLKEISFLSRNEKGELENKQKFRERNRKYNIETKGLKVVLDELKQWHVVKEATTVKYNQRGRDTNRICYSE